MGVPLNLFMPHVHSMGRGGGSGVRAGNKTTVGPDSGGYRIADEALCFGGRTLVATDIAVAAGQGGIGDAVAFAGSAPFASACAMARASTSRCTVAMDLVLVSSNVSMTAEICAHAAPTAFAAS